MPIFNDFRGVKGSRLEAVVYDTAAEVQKLKQQQTAGANIEILDLAVGEPTSLTYDVDNGISITKQGEVTASDANKYNISVSDEIPLIPGNNINIGTSEDGKHIIISSIGGGGSGVAGVSSFGGQTGDIRIGSGLTMKDKTVSAQIKPTEVVIDTNASQGTLTDNQLATLQASTLNPIVKGNEYYYLDENRSSPESLSYSHIGYEGSKWYTKNITITLSNNSWVLTINTIPEPVSINNKTGNIELGANLSISESNVLSATNTVTTVNGAYGSVTLAEGNNISLSKAGNTITISASGGGGSGTNTGFDNVREIQAADDQTTYNPDTKEYLISSGKADIFYKDGTKTSIPYVQEIGLMAGDNITFTEELIDNTNWRLKINVADYKPTLTLETNSATRYTNHYGRVYYSFNVDSTVANDVANKKYNVIIYDQTSGGGYYYCPLEGDTMTFLGEEVPNNNNSSKPSSIVGWTFKEKENDTTISFWRDSSIIGGGGGSTYSVVEITSSTTTLTDEQYNTLTASPFNKIKLNNTIYDLYEETSAQLIYAANYFNNGYQITITKSTKAVSTGSLSSLIAISAFVKNDLNYNQSNTRFALSAYQGKVLNDRLTALESGGGGGSATLYQHTITYSSDKFNSMEDFSGADVSGSFSISFYSTHGHFEDASAFWAWLIGRGSINVCDGQLWGSMGGGDAFTRIIVLGNTDAEKYIRFESYGGYGQWNPIQYFLKNPDATGLTDTIIDGCRDM